MTAPSDTPLTAEASVRRPANRDAAADLIRQARAERWSIGAPAADYHWDLSQLQERAAFNPADMLLTVETGLSLRQVQEIARAENLWLPLDSTMPEVPLAELLARDASLSWLSHRHGLARDWVMSITALDDQGRQVFSGARVVKNVAGYRLAPLYIGARHCLGPVLELSLRLLPQPANLTVITCGAAEPAPLLELWTRSRLGEQLAESGLPWEAVLIERRGEQWKLHGFTRASKKRAADWARETKTGKRMEISSVKRPPNEDMSNPAAPNVLLQVLPSQVPDLLTALAAAEVDLKCYPSAGAVVLGLTAALAAEKNLKEALMSTRAWGGSVRPLTLAGARILGGIGIRERVAAVFGRVKNILDPDNIFGRWPEELW
ncbi:MAG: FAD-binding oxidoreductase [Candidatus Marinimicrobia bacterium]|nr:FAD-binding oxidoreductase [Candidatus Neomarinimicrobiota bacterium]